MANSIARLGLRRGPAAVALFAGVLGANAAHAACACTGMTINHTTGSTITMCSDSDLNFPECNKVVGGAACTTKYAYTCPVGVKSVKNLEQTVGFQVDATLTGTSNECKSGQALQLTITSNQGVNKPKVHGTPSGVVKVGNFSATMLNDRRFKFPDVGTTSNNIPLFGADSYTDPASTELLIQDTGSKILWWDNTDQSKNDQNEAATWQYRFYSYVLGTSADKGCACIFDITIDWPATKSATTTMKVDNASTNCTF